MRVLISAVYIKPSKVGGVQHFFIELIRGLEQTGIKNQFFIFVRKEAAELLNFVKNDPRFYIKEVNLKYFKDNRFLWETFALPLIAKKLRIDVLFFPNYFVPPLIRKIPSITTVHDLQFLHFPKNFSFLKRIWLHFCMRFCLPLSTKVIAISEYTRSEILAFYPKISNRVVTIYNPVKLKLKDSNNVDFEKPEKYVLSVAHQYPHKNLDTLLKALMLLPKDLHLVLVGQKDKLSAELKKMASEQELVSRIVFTGYIEDDHLHFLYKHAEVFVLPTLFEGFGIPLVESMLAGVPVVTTKLTSVPEVTIGKARYVHNPIDAEELANAIQEVISNRSNWVPTPETIDTLSEKFNPSLIALQYLKQFEEAISKGF